MEAVRIIKEMRKATNGEYPTFALWENVPGAFSSNNGEDFKVVLEEIIKIVEPTTTMPSVPQKGWSLADSYVGDGWSLAYRVLDAQYWGVPQRRRRIYLVTDFGGQRAREILFEREGLRGYFTQGRTPWQTTPTDAQGSTGTDDREGEGLDGGDRGRQLYAVTGAVYSVENHPADSRVNVDDSGKVQTLTSRMGTGGGNVPMVMEPFCKSARAQTADDATTWKHGKVANTLNTFDQGESRANELVVETIALEGNGQRPSHRGDGYSVSDKSYTLNATEVHGVAYQNGQEKTICVADHPTPKVDEKGVAFTLNARDYKNPAAVIYEKPPRYIVRRLTPTECARLQGFADRWGVIDQKTNFTDDEYRFWLEVRNTHARINGKKVQDYTVKQMLTWYNKLQTDSSEYKMWGNGIALPTALYALQGIADALQSEENEIEDWML